MEALIGVARVLGEFDRAEGGDPPFYRGEKGDWHGEICDHFNAGDATACDERSQYLIEWRQQPYDAGTIPVSGCCERHALLVDRRLVVRFSTHPRLSS